MKDNTERKRQVSRTPIGTVIREKLKESKRSVVWFASELNCSRTNAYKIFSKSSVDANELMKISLILNFDFFRLYSDEFKLRNREK